MKYMLISILTLLCSYEAFAGCTKKCLIRNPTTGNCAFESAICPLSIETLAHWIGGDKVKILVTQHLKRLDPNRAVQFYADRLDLNLDITDGITDCLVSAGAAGSFGSVCVAGIIELGPLCLADAGCAAICFASASSFKSAINTCSR